MKIYSDPTANLLYDPTPTGIAQFSNYTPGITEVISLVNGTNAIGGSTFLRATVTVGGTTTSNFAGPIYGGLDSAICNPGDKVIFSAYVRPSITLSMGILFEGREGIVGINNGFSVTNSTTYISCPANTWTRISGSMLCNKPLNSSGIMIPRPFVSCVSGTNLPTGTTIDISNMMLTRGDVLLNYFDGNTAGCTWVDIPNNSVSVNNSNLQWYTPTVYTPGTVYNEIFNPIFVGGTTIAPLWAQYSGGSTGSFSTATNAQTITATSINAGGYFGLYATALDGTSDLIPLQVVVPNGSSIYYMMPVNIGSKNASTNLVAKVELYAADGTTLVGSTTNTFSTAFVTGGVKVTADAYYVKYAIYLSAPSNFSGTSSITLSSATVAWYFGFGYSATIAGDGGFSGASGSNNKSSVGRWMGTPHASKSAKDFRFGKIVTNNINVYNGSSWVTG